MGVVIVAIPSEQDPVWKYSSEKVPHMTLIYLGDIENQGSDLEEIALFLQHIVDTSLPRFGMSVDRRGTLGPDEADVLFFKDSYDHNVKVARNFMLQEPHIRAAYENADQFDGWTPHLTMGYPATPAKKDDREYPGFNWVNFDRIALWTGDYSGPTFELKDQYVEYETPSTVVAMSDTLSESYAGISLAHHGVKGMKWGVHHEKRLQLLKRVANGTATKTERIHVGLTEVSGDSIKQTGSLAAAAHHKAKELEERKTRIQAGKGTFKDRIALSGGDRLYESSGRKAVKKHNSEKPSPFEKEPFVKHTLAGIVLDDDILEHHGVKGMHWGVRKDVSKDSGTPDTANTDRSGYSSKPVARAQQEIKERTSSEVTARTTPGRGVRTVGGAGREASADAIRARTAQQVAKKSTLDALSNKELQDLVTRMNLEQQYNRLAFEEGDSRASAGEKFARKALNDYGDTAVSALASNPTTAALAVPVGLAVSGLKAVDSARSKKLADAPGVQNRAKQLNKNSND